MKQQIEIDKMTKEKKKPQQKEEDWCIVAIQNKLKWQDHLHDVISLFQKSQLRLPSVQKYSPQNLDE